MFCFLSILGKEFAMSADKKTAYICGPLTELSSFENIRAKGFYERIAGIYQNITGVRAFVPHEHCDPVKHSTLTPSEVDTIERRQVCELTTILVVVALAPSWGGGIEVEMARSSGVPVLVLCPKNKNISRLLKGNPAVQKIISYETEDEALVILEDSFIEFTAAAA